MPRVVKIRAVRARRSLKVLALAAFFSAFSAGPVLALPSRTALAPKPAKHKHPTKHGKSVKGGAKAARALQPAAEPAPATKAPLSLAFPITRTTLDNGVTVVLSPDHNSPVISVVVSYDVGSRHEDQGQSGFAHLFEHLMFHGTANLPKGELEKEVLGRGGFLSASTYHDFTNYYLALPSSELSFALWAEADRMRGLGVTPAAFEAERSIVKEEFRLRVSNDALGPARIKLEELVYQGFFPYAHPPIGAMEDLDRATLEWVKKFYDRYYVPNRAVVSVAGDFDNDQAMELMHRYFDKYPRVELPAPAKTEELPEQTNERTASLQSDFAAAPSVFYGFAAAPADHNDRHALELLAILLGGGQSSRLSQKLVREKPILTEVSASMDVRRGPGLFTIEAKLAQGTSLSEAEKSIEEELKTIALTPPSAAELEKAKRIAQTRLAMSLAWIRDRAIALGRYEILLGDARKLQAEFSRYQAVTPGDFSRVAKQYLGPLRRNIVESYPKVAPPAPKPEAKASAHAPPAHKAAHAKPKKPGAKKPKAKKP